MTRAAARKRIGPCHQVRAPGGNLVGITSRELVYRVEILIELHIDLLPINARAAEGKDPFVSAAECANPSITGRVQTIAAGGFIVIGKRHLAEQLAHKSGGIYGSSIRIPRIPLNDCIRTIGPGWNVLQ